MKKIFLLLSSMAVAILFTASSSDPAKKGLNHPPVPHQKSLAEISPEVLPGMIVIKLKEGINPRCGSNGPVLTGINSLDEKIASIEATSFVKRFKHNPVPPGSGKPDISRIYRLTFPENFESVQVAALFRSDPNVEYAETEMKMHICEEPDDPMYVFQQHLPQIMAQQAWNIHKGENGTTEVKIAIVDTGVDWYHEDLQDNVWQNLGEDANGDGHTVHYGFNGVILDPSDLNGIDDDGNGFVDDLVGWDFYEASQTGSGSDPDPDPNNAVGAHGSHCAGIACATTNNGAGVAGITWNLKYLPINADIANDLTYGWDGIIYAADMGADVISNSWGGLEYHYNEFIAEMIAYVNASGSIIVFAAGNDGIEGNHQPSYYPGAISVGSVNGDDTKVSYSNYGLSVDVMAPGGGLEGGILSTVPGNEYERYFGTSMATPLVAGLMGLVKSYHPEWTNDQVIAQVIATCDNIDGINPNYANKLGNGRINAYQALANPGATPPQQLKLEMLGYTIADADNDGKLLPGDIGTISLKIRNYSHCVSSDAVNFTISNDDDQVTIDNGSYTGIISSDSIFDFTGIFQFSVSGNATSHPTFFNLNISADIQVILEQDLIIPVMIAPSGFFVFERYPNGRDYSGSYIRQYLDDMGYPVTYSNYFPQSLLGYDAAFLSMGNMVFPKIDPGTMLTEDMVQVVVDYLKTGGKLYIEGGGVLVIPYWFNYANYWDFKSGLGIGNMDYADKNPIDTLKGIDGTICEDMLFTSSSQYNNNWIEKLYPLTAAYSPLEENNHGKVAVYYSGSYGQKTFYFTYSLSDLTD